MNESAMETLRALNEQRLNVAERLIAEISNHDRLSSEMDKCLATIKSLTAEAERVGWSKKDLLSAGVKLPGERRRSPASRKNRSKRVSKVESDNHTENSQGEHNHE